MRLLMMSLNLKASHYDQIIHQAQQGAPLEICGLIAGHGRNSSQIYPIDNSEKSPVKYQLDSHQHFKALKEIEKNGLELIGIYHSHPQSPAYPSETDIELSYYPELTYLIVTLMNEKPQLRAFEIKMDKKVKKVNELKIEIIS